LSCAVPRPGAPGRPGNWPGDRSPGPCPARVLGFEGKGPPLGLARGRLRRRPAEPLLGHSRPWQCPNSISPGHHFSHNV
jgi:hypothetical protein